MEVHCGHRRETTSRRARLKPIVLVATLAAMLIAPAAAHADATLSPGLADASASNPEQVFRVIVQGDPGHRSQDVADDVEAAKRSDPGQAIGLKRRLISIDGVSAELTGKQILKLSHKRGILAISVDQPVRITSQPIYSSLQRWPYASGAAKFWTQLATGNPSTLANPPTIAVVDSGVDPDVPDLAGRVIHEENFTSLPDNSPQRRARSWHLRRQHRGRQRRAARRSRAERGHRLARRRRRQRDGPDERRHRGRRLDPGRTRTRTTSASPTSRCTARSPRRSASTRSTRPSSGSGSTASSSSRQRATTARRSQGVLYAPGNDPFVITVGAVDLNDSIGTGNDFAAPWSAYGSTLDGFAKPEISAPGRFMVGAIPAGSALALERPDRLVEPGLPAHVRHVVRDARRRRHRRVHPRACTRTSRPDQVKGALMLTARPTPSAAPGSAGVGEVAADRAADVANPPNPNLSLDQFVVPAPDGGAGRVFDEATWTTYAAANPAWDAATWTTATWTTATWTTATWTTAAWQAATWVSATWTTATWTTATWTTATWTTANDATWTTSAESEANATSGEFYDPAEKADAEDALGITPNP